MSANLRSMILAAARAEHIPKDSSGLWFVNKIAIASPVSVPRPKNKTVIIPPGSYTQLFRMTMATMHHHTPAELVMCDMPDELNTHLDFMMRATGRVLITGLGLGCVARGCAIKPNVESVTVIERDDDVLRLVRPFMLEEKIKVIQADALEWVESTSEKFDCAWHDLWSDPDDDDEPHLQINHGKLVGSMAGRVKFQGAWAMPREFRRSYRQIAACL